MAALLPFRKNTYFQNGDKIYRDDIFPWGTVPNMMNTWGRDSYYGLINSVGNAVIPKESALKPLKYCGPQKVLYAMDFVSDAWRDFVEKIRQLALNNILPKDSPWTTLQAYKAWEPAEVAYDNYLTQMVFPTFNEIYMSLGAHQHNVTDVESFLQEFTSYNTHVLSYAGPLTLSGFMESPTSNPLMSGLIIEVSADRYDDDLNKSATWGGTEFQLIASIAAEYGFSIDQHIPWRLIANIGSPALQEYMYGVPLEDVDVDNRNLEKCDDPLLVGDVNVGEHYGFSQVSGYEGVMRHVNVYQHGTEIFPGYIKYKTAPTNIEAEDDIVKVFDSIFSAAYVETWHLDIEILKPYLLQFYNSFASTYNTVSFPRWNSECEMVEATVVERLPAGFDIFSGATADYRDRWALKCFYMARLSERQIQKTPDQRTADIRRFLNLYDFAPRQNYVFALRFIHEDLLGPLLEEPLTYHRVGDILEGERSPTDDIPNSG